jgi:hypothetical protein
MQDSGNDAPPRNSTNDQGNQAKRNDECVHSGGCVHKQVRPPPTPAVRATLPQYPTNSWSKSDSQKRWSLQKHWSMPVELTGCQQSGSGSLLQTEKAHQGSRSHTRKGSLLTPVNCRRSSGPAQGAVTRALNICSLWGRFIATIACPSVAGLNSLWISGDS